ncbi:hypothetical protein [Halosimplex sp. TS25]|uniref:DUF7260 family protein n=1 Tax=Halosimplex rarum TaxID=3396619 RepID=UPI0039EB4792
MSVETHVHRARERARSERDAFDAKLDAYGRFVERVADVTAETTGAPAADVATTGGAGRYVGRSTPDCCRSVRTAFAETVRPHSVADVDESEPLLASIRAELGDPVAVALAPATEASFSAEVKRAVLSEATARKTQTAVVRRALEREVTGLETAATLVDEATAWIAETDETPLCDVGFDGLRERHETLAAFSDRCDEAVHERQSRLRSKTGHDVDSAVDHRDLVAFLYGDFPVDYPVLSTVARLDETCRECRRTVRDHLVRRA